MAKIDLKNAFRMVPVHPADRHLLVMRWGDMVYIDTCLPFELRSAPRIFNMLVDMLEWIALDNGPPKSPICYHNLQLLSELCTMLGVPLGHNKVEGPFTSIEFLGILIDTIKIYTRLPEEKLSRAQTTVKQWLHKMPPNERYSH